MANVAFRTQHSDIWWVFLLQGLAGIVLGEPKNALPEFGERGVSTY